MVDLRVFIPKSHKLHYDDFVTVIDFDEMKDEGEVPFLGCSYNGVSFSQFDSFKSKKEAQQFIKTQNEVPLCILQGSILLNHIASRYEIAESQCGPEKKEVQEFIKSLYA